MKSDKSTLALALVGALILVGCGKPHPESQPGDSEPAAPATADTQLPAPPAKPSPATATDKTRSGGGEFTRNSLASPFAQADQALKESFDAALIAFQIGNYARAASELRLLVKTPGLTREQERAVQYLSLIHI